MFCLKSRDIPQQAATHVDADSSPALPKVLYSGQAGEGSFLGMTRNVFDTFKTFSCYFFTRVSSTEPHFIILSPK
ncbi:hypothetical protein SAMN06265350_106163 [Solitalea koreensis]|uniref:Uncharacterized protein n=1 Tax=Solitalea koreensis TaxID=543615 RepID=A0A521DBC7_9SPHI|nr:hypothetical protein SAMN06265350_106163 [Solitalea koreensis]